MDHALFVNCLDEAHQFALIEHLKKKNKIYIKQILLSS